MNTNKVCLFVMMLAAAFVSAFAAEGGRALAAELGDGGYWRGVPGARAEVATPENARNINPFRGVPSARGGVAVNWDNSGNGYGVPSARGEVATRSGRGDAGTYSDGWTVRVMSMHELERLGDRDWDLSPSYAKRLLARLNARDFDYIDADIRNGRPIKVPNNFSAFKSWTPLPRYIAEVASLPRFILIAKDIPFIGWYENGRLVGDSYICIGRMDDWTLPGVYTVKEKDVDHVSRSYPNAYGEPAPMPWALRIYGLIWIHAGDIVGPHCSHGCINLPMEPAVRLFEWAARGTPVVIVDALNDTPTVLARNRSNCSLYASVCAMPAPARRNG